MNSFEPAQCATCNGSGIKLVQHWEGDGCYETIEVDCPACQGWGVIPNPTEPTDGKTLPSS